MSKTLAAGLIVLCSTIFLFGQQLIDGVAAIVGEKAILYSEVDQIAQLIAIQSGMTTFQNAGMMQELRAGALEELINQQVLLEYARQETILVEDRNVELQLEQSLAQIEAQYGSLQNAAEMFGVDRRKIKKYYEDQIRSNMLIEQVKFELFNDIKVSRREVEDFYTTWQDSFPEKNLQVDFSILSLPIVPGEGSKVLLRSRLDSIRTEIQAGRLSFEDAATIFSRDPGSSANGGKLGFVGRGVFVKPFEDAAFSMEIGELSEPVETQFGFHLLRLDDKRGEQVDVSHILLTPVLGSSDEEATRDKLMSIRGMLENGELSFAEAVREHTEDEFIRSRNGRMGATDITLLPIEMHDLLTNIPIESLSMPLSTGDQLHVILVHARIPGGRVNLNDHWAEIENMSLEFKKRDRYDVWILDQRQRMYITINY